MSRKKFSLVQGAGSLFGSLLLLAAVSCGEASPEKESSSPEQKQASLQKRTARPQTGSRKKKSAYKDRQTGSLKVRFSSSSRQPEKAQVRIDDSNVTVFSGKDAPPSVKARRISRKEQKLLDSLRAKRPSNVLSSSIAASRSLQNIRWSPRMRSDTSLRSRIECCAISRDESVILFVETVGEEQGPFGSRLVFLDTYSWKILSVHHLKEHYVKEVSFLRDGSCLLSCRGQEALQTEDSVIHFDTVLFRILTEFRIDGLRKAWSAPDGRHFLVTYRKDSAFPGKISTYVLDGSSTNEIRSVTGGNTSVVLAYSAKGNIFYSCGDRGLESYSIRNLKLQSRTALPADFVCADLLELSPGILIAAPEDGLHQKTLMIRDSSCRAFGEISAGRLFALPSPRRQNEFGALLRRKGKIGCYTLPSLDETLEIFPEECRERTVGNPWYVFVLKHCPEAFAVLDQSGNFYLLYRGKNERRFRKEILISGMSRKKK